MSRNRQVTVLVVLCAVLVAIVVYEWPRDGVTDGGVAAAVRGSRNEQAGKAQQGALAQVPPVRLDKLAAARAEKTPPPPQRNPFTFEAPRSAAMEQGRGAFGRGRGAVPGGPVAQQPAPVVPVGPPPPPPINLKFIGVVSASNQKLAVLSDATTHDVFYGREGDIIDGRYRILRIGVESIEMAYVDGRGRQSIRLSGS